MKLKDIAHLLGGELIGDPELDITGVAGIEDAQKGDITFAIDEKALNLVRRSKASCVIVKEPAGGVSIANILVEDPSHAFAVLLGRMYPEKHGVAGVAEGAHVHPAAKLGEGVVVYAGAYISERASIGKGTVIYPGVFVGRGSIIGSGCVLYPNCVVRDGVRLGDRVILHPCAVIGADGFGYAFHEGEHFKIPQRGAVLIEDDVEIGACSAVDRATTPRGRTVIGKGTKIDNLVQVGHNCKIGRHVILVAQVGIGGSAQIGNYVMMGGQAAIADHAVIEDEAQFAARSGGFGHIKKGVYAGAPTMPHRDFFRSSSLFAKLPELNRRISKLEEKLGITGGGKEDDDGR